MGGYTGIIQVLGFRVWGLNSLHKGGYAGDYVGEDYREY